MAHSTKSWVSAVPKPFRAIAGESSDLLPGFSNVVYVMVASPSPVVFGVAMVSITQGFSEEGLHGILS